MKLSEQKKVLHKKSHLGFSADNRALTIMLMPALVWVIVFAYLPMCGLVLAFKNYNFAQGIFGSPWCGLDNFKYFFMSGKAWLLIKNTFGYNILFIITSTVAQVFVAVFLSELKSKRYKKSCQSVMLLPHFISWVVVAAFMYNLFNVDYGTIPNLAKNLGLGDVKIYSTPEAWPVIMVVVNLWKGIGYGSVYYLAAITGIDPTCYEAAEIDGATTWKRIRYITIPLLKPTIFTMTLLSVGQILRGNFQMFYQLIGTNGLLYNATDIIDTYVYRSLLTSSDIGMSSAAAFFQSVVCLIMIVAVNKIVKTYEADYALF